MHVVAGAEGGLATVRITVRAALAPALRGTLAGHMPEAAAPMALGVGRHRVDLPIVVPTVAGHLSD
eukprot:5835553-Lingulodinium_polyedra.AAC.1